MVRILDGNETATALKETLRVRIADLKKRGRTPELAIVLVGDSKPAIMYANFMEKVAQNYDLKATIHTYESHITEETLGKEIEILNGDEQVTGILMMMPLPQHIDGEKMVQHIDPDKDVDGLTTMNAGRLLMGHEGFFPCTPRAVIAILKHYGISLAGKKAVIIGRSNIVGKPVALLLMGENATVTVCHSKTKNLSAVTKEADILVAAIGKPKAVTADMVKPGAVVIDVGINRVEGKTVGDVDYDAVAEVAGAITPVPGGVGAVTTTMVVESLLQALEKRNEREGI